MWDSTQAARRWVIVGHYDHNPQTWFFYCFEGYGTRFKNLPLHASKGYNFIFTTSSAWTLLINSCLKVELAINNIRGYFSKDFLFIYYKAMAYRGCIDTLIIIISNYIEGTKPRFFPNICFSLVTHKERWNLKWVTNSPDLYSVLLLNNSVYRNRAMEIASVCFLCGWVTMSDWFYHPMTFWSNLQGPEGYYYLPCYVLRIENRKLVW